MLSVPASVQTLFKTDGTRKNFRVQFPNGEFPDITNENIVRESLHFTESLCSQNVFRFGLAEASVLEFETVGIGNMYGMTINASIEIDVSSLTDDQIAFIEARTWDGELVTVDESDIGFPFFRVPLGVFRVESCPRDHGAMTHRKVTSYSLAKIQNTPTGTIPGMPTEIPFYNSYEADFAGVTAANDGNGLVKIGEFTPNNNFLWGLLFDSTGTEYTVTLNGIYDGQQGAVAVERFAGLPSPTASTHPDFLKISEYNEAEYYALGDAVAEALDASGADLTYDTKKKKIYATNKDALLEVMPWLFHPTLHMAWGDTNWLAQMKKIEPLQPGRLHGVIWGGTYYPVEDALFRFSDNGDGPAYYVSCVDTSGANELSLHLMTGPSTWTEVPVPLVYSGAAPTVEVYQGTKSGLSVKAKTSGSLGKRSSVWTNKNTGNVASRPLEYFSFVNSVDYAKLINGGFEMLGQFYKPKRTGGFKEVELLGGVAPGIYPGDYDSLWWDEYDVSPIGSVVVAGKDTNTEIKIGDGASVYDMTDNEAMKLLPNTTAAGIKSQLDANFTFNATNLEFTPIELIMQGWPWLEAGDLLLITAGNDLVVSFALRIEMSGVQYLVSTITADGGEIVGET